MTNASTEEGAPEKKPYLRGMIRKLGSPYEMARPPNLVWLVFAMFMLAQSGNSFGPATFAVAMSILMITMIVCVTRPAGRARMLHSILKLQRAIPWFEAHPVTSQPMPTDAELDAMLRPEGYDRVTLDGATIRSWRDLADQLQQHTSPMKFPEEPRARTLSLLAQMSDETPRRVVVWRDAMRSVEANPALVSTFVGDWSSHAPTMRPGLLVFVDLPASADVEEAEPLPKIERGDVGEAPDRSILQDAPEGAWWKPKPGELAK